MPPILDIKGLSKIYAGGFHALRDVNLQIKKGEIIALLGPNGAGKTTLISTICGITMPTSGSVSVAGHDVGRDYRAARSLIGLVPQEISLEPFEKVINTLRFSRGLFGKPRNDAAIHDLLDRLSLSDKIHSQIKELSGGMRRRVMIAKALVHEPEILFLDEPTAGVDVELRKDMWQIVDELKARGVTIILTTHYIEEAEAIADRIGVINNGQLMLVEEKDALMARMGRKELEVQLSAALSAVPEALFEFDLHLTPDGTGLIYAYDTRAGSTGITRLLTRMSEAGLVVRDVVTRETSLEDIFVTLVRQGETT